MPRFVALEVQTDVRCASGARVATFPVTDLAECRAVLSPTDPESLIATIQRSDPRAAEAVAGRVLRTCFSDATADREWDIIAVEDGDVGDTLTLTAQPIALRMARKLYVDADGATGAPVLDFTEVGISAADAIDRYVLPTLAARGMSWVARGTVDSTGTFDLSGQWASILEIVRAIAEPGRANGEWQLRRNGDTDYKLDIRDALGASAGTLRIRTNWNLLDHRRSRSVLEATTRVFPRGSELGYERTMAAHLWRVKTVVSGTELELEDILGGAGPVGYDGQLTGKYLARLDAATYSDQVITNSTASGHRVFVASTAAYSAGEWVRVREATGANGARLTSLTNPVAAALPSAGGLGDIAEFLDRPEVRGDCNLVPNPWHRDWANSSNPADGWTESAGTPANRTRARETTLIRESPYTFRITTTGSTTLYVETPDIPVWAISGRRHFAALWFYVDAVPAATDSAVIIDLYTSGGTKIVELGRWLRGDTPSIDQWLRLEPAVVDLSAVTGKVRIRLTLGTATTSTAASGWNIVISNALLAEAEIPVEDIEYSGGTRLWQEANRRLQDASAALRGDELKVADLEADDPDVFASLLVTAGQDVELTDDVLGEVSQHRVLEYRPDYLHPLASALRVGSRAPSAMRDLTPPGITPAPPGAATPASLSLVVTHDDDNYYIAWSGGPIVQLSVDGRNSFAAPPPSPITVERPAATGFTRFYLFVAESPEDGSRVEQLVVIERKPLTGTGSPTILGVSISSTYTPCDGGGDFDLALSVADMPGTETYDWTAKVFSGWAVTQTQDSDTGVAPGSFPVTPSLDLCSGARVLITVIARVGGVEIASYQTTETI